MKKDFKSIAFLAVFTMIVGCAFYCIGFYDSAVFTLLVGLTMLAVYHAGLYNRGIIEDNTIASQKEIIERDKLGPNPAFPLGGLQPKRRLWRKKRGCGKAAARFSRPTGAKNGCRNEGKRCPSSQTGADEGAVFHQRSAEHRSLISQPFG